MAYDEVIHLKKVGGGGGGGSGGITPSSTDTLTNKTIDDYTNFIHADGIHLRVKATEPLVKGDVIKFVGFNDGEQAIEVAKRDNINVPAIGVIYTATMDTGEFGMAVSNGLFKGINTSAFSVGTILYPNASGGFTSTNPGGYAQQMAYVVRSHAVNGEIMINVGPVYGLDKRGLTGNAGTNPTTNFIGTTDAQEVVFKSNNLEFLRGNIFGDVYHNLNGDNTTVAFGFNSGRLNTGSNNSFYGSLAGASNTTGTSNTFIGQSAGRDTTTGSNNMYLGTNAGRSCIVGVNNTAVGFDALKNNLASANTAIGVNALLSNTTGSNNMAVGVGALASNNTGTSNTAIGVEALTSQITSAENTAIGYRAGRFTIGQYNTYIGANTGTSSSSGSSNTIMGRNCFTSNTTGSNNTVMGVLSLMSNTTGNSNIAIGIVALNSNTTGGANIAMGENALNNNTTGGANIAMGRDALRSNINGGNNYGIGQNTLYSLSSGSGNFAMGLNAGKYITDGSPLNTANDSFYLGFNTRALSDNAQREIVIGSNAIGNGSNTITIGGSTNTKVALNGKIETNNDFETTNIGSGIIIKSPNGTRRRITVDNTGALTTTAL